VSCPFHHYSIREIGVLSGLATPVVVVFTRRHHAAAAIKEGRKGGRALFVSFAFGLGLKKIDAPTGPTASACVAATAAVG